MCDHLAPLKDTLVFDHLKFLHPVGPSTFKYGITIPVAAQTARLSGR